MRDHQRSVQMMVLDFGEVMGYGDVWWRGEASVGDGWEGVVIGRDHQRSSLSFCRFVVLSFC